MEAKETLTMSFDPMHLNPMTFADMTFADMIVVTP